MRVRLQTIPQRLSDGLGRHRLQAVGLALISARSSDRLKFKNPPTPAVKHLVGLGNMALESMSYVAPVHFNGHQRRIFSDCFDGCSPTIG